MEDVEAAHRWLGDQEVMSRIPGGHSLIMEDSSARLRKYIEHQRLNGFSLWAVVEKAGGEIIGDCGLYLVEGRGPEVELVYRLRKEYWGRGFAVEAAKEYLRFGLQELGLGRIIAVTDPDHTASRRVMEHIGMIFSEIREISGRPMVVYEKVMDILEKNDE